ncbi:MAG: hypothetical protein PHH12_01315 [Candidatus Shapirobacteria bacterium]|nr:hypothetical protein [Candidatus Shapirobacteria bacterium]
MIGYLDKHIREINEKIKNVDSQNWKVILEHHREAIKFMQHERLIHLLVTLAFGIMFMVVMMFTLIYPSTILLVIDGLFLILLVPYIFHYFKLENGVQKLYWIDKLIQKKIKA